MKEMIKKVKWTRKVFEKQGAALTVTRQNQYKNGSTSLARITLDALAALLRTGGRHVEQVEALRHELAYYRGRGIDFTFDKTVERIIPQALVVQRDGNWLLAGYEGIVMLKLENVFGEEVAQAVKRAAAQLPMTLMAFTGASGMSTYLLVRVRATADTELSWTDIEQVQAFHKAAFATAAQVYESVLPQTVSRETGSRLTDDFMLSLDAQLYYNPDAMAMPIDMSVVMPEVTRPGVDPYLRELLLPVPSDTLYRQYYDERWKLAVEEANKRFKKAGRDRAVEESEGFMPTLTAVCFELSIPLPEARARMLANLGMNTSDIVRYVNSYYAQHDPISQLDEKSARGVAGMIIWLNKNYAFYRNTVNDSIFYRQRTTSDKWHIFGREELATLTVEVQRAGFQVNRGHVKDYVYSRHIPHLDPIAQFQKRVGQVEWDGQDRIEGLAKLVSTSFEPWPRFFHVWFCAMVNQMTGGNGFDGNALMPLIIGPQGIGKSRFCRALLPPELRWGWMEKVDFSKEEKVLRAMSQFLLINIDEFNQTAARVQKGTLKNMLQLPDVRLPRPYSAAFEVLKRRASFIGTCNPSEVLADDSGARRYICVKVRQGHRIELPVDLDYVQLYAQAVHELRERRQSPERFAATDPRGRTFLTPEEEKMLMEHNLQFQTPSFAAEYFDSCFEPISEKRNANDDRWHGTIGLTRPEIITHLEKLCKQHFSDNEKSRLSTHLDELVGKGLLAKYHTRKGATYHLRPIKAYK